MTTFRHILKLDPHHRETRAVVADAQLMHKAVMAGFDDQLPDRDFFADGTKPHPTHRADHHILHAVDTRPDGQIWVMVQADIPGNWSNARIADALIEPVEPAKHTPAANGHIHYQIVANPTFSPAGTRKKFTLTKPAEIEEWWRRKANGIGLNLDGHRINIMDTQRLRSKTKRGLTLTTTRIGGDGVVVDHDAFTEALRTGVGRGKAYGCGLLLTLPGRG